MNTEYSMLLKLDNELIFITGDKDEKTCASC